MRGKRDGRAYPSNAKAKSEAKVVSRTANNAKGEQVRKEEDIKVVVEEEEEDKMDDVLFNLERGMDEEDEKDEEDKELDDTTFQSDDEDYKDHGVSFNDGEVMFQTGQEELRNQQAREKNAILLQLKKDIDAVVPMEGGNRGERSDGKLPTQATSTTINQGRKVQAEVRKGEIEEMDKATEKLSLNEKSTNQLRDDRTKRVGEGESRQGQLEEDDEEHSDDDDDDGAEMDKENQGESEDEEEDEEVEEEEEEEEEEQEGEETRENIKNMTFAEKLKQARHNLLLSAHPSRLPGREMEMDRIQNHILSCLNNNTTDLLYISGTPGTGKTASVRAVIARLAALAADKTNNVPLFDHIEINGLQLTQPRQLYVELYKKLFCIPDKKRKPTANLNINVGYGDALLKLENLLRKASPKRRYCVLVVDEFDLLVTKKQQVIYNLCGWAHLKNAKLILIAIANTMNLPGTLNPKVQSRLGQNRLDFKAYLRPVLVEIIISRLQDLHVFRPEAIMLVAARVSGISGDARRALEICRRSLKIAERRFLAQDQTIMKEREELVAMDHIDAAVAQMTPKHSTILKHAVLHQRLFMCTVVNEVKLTGKFETVFRIIANKHIMLCNMHGISPPSWSVLVSICQRLGDMRFLKIGDAALDVAQPIHLVIEMDDIYLAVADDETCRKWLNLE